MFNYGVGGQEVKSDASEAIADIPLNRTMMIQKLTDVEPTRPQAVYDLKTVEEVFEFFKPQVKVDFDKADGTTTTEEFRFGSVGDFSSKSMVNRSPYLNDLNLQQEQYYKMLKQLKSNRLLKNVLDKSEAKQAFMSAVDALLNELDEK